MAGSKNPRDDNPSDEYLVKLIASTGGASAAEAILYKRYHKQLEFICGRVLVDRSMAPDICHDTFLTVIKKIRAGEIKKGRSIKHFLLTTGKNLARNYNNGARHRVEWQDPDIDLRNKGDFDEQFRTLSEEDQMSIVNQVISELNQERDREILRRRYLLDEDKEVTCKELELTPKQYSSVKWNALRRARKIIEQKRDPDNDPPGSSSWIVGFVAVLVGALIVIGVTNAHAQPRDFRPSIDLTSKAHGLAPADKSNSTDIGDPRWI